MHFSNGTVHSCVYIICPIPFKKMCVHLLSTAVFTSTVDFSRTNCGCCNVSCSAGSSKIKIQTSSHRKANRVLWRDEVRILIFDRMTENQLSQRPRSGSREGKLSNPRGCAACARCIIPPEKLQNSAREPRGRYALVFYFSSLQY